jgi:hypothetical protein
MALPLQVLKHFKFKLFFNVEPNPSIESMAMLDIAPAKELLITLLEASKS